MAIVPDESSTSASEVDFGANDWLLEEMYERYTTDPSSVDETWAEYFKSHGAPGVSEPPRQGGGSGVNRNLLADGPVCHVAHPNQKSGGSCRSVRINVRTP